MTTANNADNNLSPWQPGQSGNPSGRPRGTRDLAGYVLETTDGGKELVDALLAIVRGVVPNIPAQGGSRPRKDQQLRPADQLKAIEMLLDRGFGRSPQQLDVAPSVSDRPLEHLSDETLRLLPPPPLRLHQHRGPRQRFFRNLLQTAPRQERP